MDVQATISRLQERTPAEFALFRSSGVLAKQIVGLPLARPVLDRTAGDAHAGCQDERVPAALAIPRGERTCDRRDAIGRRLGPTPHPLSSVHPSPTGARRDPSESGDVFL